MVTVSEMNVVELVAEAVPLVVEVVKDATAVDERKVVDAVLIAAAAVLVEIVFGTEDVVKVATGLTLKRPILLPASSVKYMLAPEAIPSGPEAAVGMSHSVNMPVAGSKLPILLPSNSVK
jgi:hypothetical protein